MAYGTTGNYLVLNFRDQRNDPRRKEYELGGLVVVTDDDAKLFSDVSKSVVRSYNNRNKQVDNGLTPDADSEVADTMRLYFLMPDDTKYHLDIVDPKDALFLAATGAGSNIVKDRAVLAVGSPEEIALDSIIGKVMDGTYLISDGETPVAYVGGERI